MLARTMKTEIGMTIVIDRPHGEEDKGIAIAIVRDIDRQITVAAAVHAEGILDLAQRVAKS